MNKIIALTAAILLPMSAIQAQTFKQRVNRQYIVSVDAVESLVANFLGKMRLKLHCYKDADIIVSRAKVPMVKKWLDS